MPKTEVWTRKTKDAIANLSIGGVGDFSYYFRNGLVNATFTRIMIFVLFTLSLIKYAVLPRLTSAPSGLLLKE